MALENSSISVGGYVPQRIPVKRNLEAFSASLNKIDERAKEALQQRTQLATALGQLDINDADEEWRAAYIRDIQNQLDDAATYGDYSNALSTATVLAGKVASDPAVLGRIKANTAYKEYKKTLESRQDITQDTKDRFLEQNPYHYEDKYDKEGHIIGGTEWTPNSTPVTNVGIKEKVIDAMLKITAKHAGGGVSDVKFVDANGELTSDPSKGIYGMAYKKSGKYEYLSKADLKKGLEAAMNSVTGAKEAFQQDYDTSLWKYNKMTPEEKRNNIDSDITENGLILGPADWLRKQFQPAIDAASFYNAYNDIDYGNGYQNYRAAAATAQVNQNLLTPDANLEQSVAMEFDVKDKYAANYKLLDNIVNGQPIENGSRVGGLRQLFPNLSKTDAFNRGLRKGDYEGLANLCRHSVRSKDPNVLRQVNQLLRQLRDAGQVRNEYLKGLPKEDREAVEFNMCLESGAPLPPGNRFTISYNNNVNRLFYNGKYEKIGFSVYDDEEMRDIEKLMGIVDGSDWAKKGFTITTTTDGHKCIKFSRNNRYITQLADAVNDASPSIFSLRGLGEMFTHNRRIVGYDKNGNERKLNENFNARLKNLSTNDVAGVDIFNSWENSPAQAAKWRTDKVNSARGVNKKGLFTGAIFQESFAKKQLLADYANGKIDEKQYNILDKRLDSDEQNAFFGNELINHQIFATEDDGSGQMAKVSEEDKRDVISEIMLAHSQKRINVGYMASPLTGEYGAYYTIYPADGDKKKNNRTVFIPGVGNSVAANRFMNDTKNQATALVNQMSMVNGQISSYGGSKVTNINEDGSSTYIARNGAKKKLSREQTIAFATAERNREMLADAFATGQLAPSLADPNTLRALTHSLNEMGYSANQITKELMTNEMMIILKNY